MTISYLPSTGNMTPTPLFDNGANTTDDNTQVTKTHKELFSVHCDYNPKLNEKLHLLYVGGFDILQHAKMFLTQLTGLETPKAYDERLKCSAYIPYLCEFITQFSSTLFSEPIEIKAPGDSNDASTSGTGMEDDFYKQFFSDVDENGTSIHQFMRDVFEKALYELCVYVGVDFPLTPDAPNRPIEKELKADRAYAYTIPYENVIDYKLNAKGGFDWLKIWEEVIDNDSPLSQDIQHHYKFTIWTVENDVGVCNTWESTLLPLSRKATPNLKYTLTSTAVTSFPGVPVKMFCVPRGYHVGLQVGALCQEHYQRRSFMVSNANKTCVSVGFFAIGPDYGAPGDAAPEDINVPTDAVQLRKKLESDGWVVGRKTKDWSDSIEIIEAKGESHKFISEELQKLVESMMQVLRQMNMTARANMKSLNRSAASKQIDQHGTSMLLSVYERLVKDFTRNMCIFVAAGRNENIKFTVEGLSTAEPVPERKDLVEEITKFGVDIFKFPQTWKNKYLFRKMMDLIDNDMSDREKLEIEENLKKLVEQGVFDSAPPAEDSSNVKPPSSNDSSDDDDSLSLGPSGQPLMPDTAHLQSGQHVDPNIIYNQLSKDYKPETIKWVLQAAWRGPIEVPLSSIDFSNQSNWQASKDTDHVEHFVDLMSNQGFAKPVILAHTPADNNKMIIVDGHHRTLAYKKINQPVLAYVADVGSITSDMKMMHSEQNGASNQVERSNQVVNSNQI